MIDDPTRVRRIVLRLLILTIVFGAIPCAFAAYDAMAAEPTAQASASKPEYPVPYCDTAPVVFVPMPKSLPTQRPPVIPPGFGEEQVPNLRAFMVITHAMASWKKKKLIQGGWEIHRANVWCDTFFATDTHNARLIWNILGVVEPGHRVMHATTFCEMKAPGFPAVLHPGSIVCAAPGGRDWSWHIEEVEEEPGDDPY